MAYVLTILSVLSSDKSSLEELNTKQLALVTSLEDQLSKLQLEIAKYEAILLENRQNHQLFVANSEREKEELLRSKITQILFLIISFRQIDSFSTKSTETKQELENLLVNQKQLEIEEKKSREDAEQMKECLVI